MTARYGYSRQLCSRHYLLEVHGQTTAPARVVRDGVAVSMSSAAGFPYVAEGWFYDPASQTTWVKFSLASSATTTVSLM